MKSNTDLIEKLSTQAKTIFQNNIKEGYSSWKDANYRYIAPSKKEYVYQWLWDSAFHAIVLSHFDTNWAKSEIRNFLMGQWEDGFIPHVVFWGNEKFLPHWAYIESKLSLRPKTTALTQPPLLAIAVETIYNKDSDKDFLRDALPKLAKHHRWLLKNRDNDSDYLISIISPNESGMDESPTFQAVAGFLAQDTARLHFYYRKGDFLNQFYRFNSKVILRKDYFNCEELLFNCIFIESARALARLFLEIQEFEEAKFFSQIAKLSEKALLKKCWDKVDNFFYSLYSNQEKFTKVKTVANLVPLILDGLDHKKAEILVKQHLLNPSEYWTNYPIPSVSKDEIYYSPNETPFYKIKLLWRGPTWVNTNWLVVKGLKKHGFNGIANQIIDKMCQMIEKSGFREYYNPETGEGYRRDNFGWSTLLLDLIDS